MHRTLDCVGNTRVLELCPAKRLGNEQISFVWRICVHRHLTHQGLAN